MHGQGKLNRLDEAVWITLIHVKVKGLQFVLTSGFFKSVSNITSHEKMRIQGALSFKNILIESMRRPRRLT